MHFSTLVPVTVKITDQDHKRAAEATQHLAAINNRLADNTENLGAQVALKCKAQYCAALNNAFASAVETAVSEVMEPYSENAEDPKYRVFEDETEFLKSEFETNTVDCIQYGAKYYSKDGLKGFRVCKDGVVREVTTDGREWLSDKAKQMKVVTVTAKEFYKSFKKYANERAYYDEEHKAWGYYTNPNAFYDWYSIGGRWQAPLLVKADCQECAIGVPGAGGDGQLPPAPDGYKWTSAARIKDIQWDAMVQESIADYTRQYEKLKEMWDTHTISDGHDAPCYTFKPDGIYYLGKKAFDATISFEESLAQKNFTAKRCLSQLCYSYLETRIEMEPDEDGYLPFGYHETNNNEDEWADTINEFVASFPSDTVLAICDCHI